MKRIFITGGFGFLGLNLISYIQSQQPDIRFTVLNPTNEVLDLSKLNVELINKSILDFTEKDADMNDVDAIILFAGLSGRDIQADKNIAEININANRNILKIAEKQGSTAHVIFPSSHLVYDFPNNPYAQSKIKFESFLEKHIGNNNNLSFTSFRITNPYGPHLVKAQGYNYANQMLYDLLQGKEINLYYSGELIKNYLPVQNLSKIIYDTIHEKLFRNETIDLGHFEDISMIDFYSKAKEVFGKGEINKDSQDLPKPEKHISTEKLYSQISKEGLMNHEEALMKFKQFYEKFSNPKIEDFLIRP